MEYFLVAHAAIKGTARPTKYIVISDDEDWKPSELHALTHRLCYSYARSTTSVSLVNVAYYAHLIGNRVRVYCGAPPASGNQATVDYAKFLPALNAEYVCLMTKLTLQIERIDVVYVNALSPGSLVHFSSYELKFCTQLLRSPRVCICR